MIGFSLHVRKVCDLSSPQSSWIRNISSGSEPTKAILRMLDPALTVKAALKFASTLILEPFKCAAGKCTLPESLSAKTVNCMAFAALKVLGPEGSGPGGGLVEPDGAVEWQGKGLPSVQGWVVGVVA